MFIKLAQEINVTTETWWHQLYCCQGKTFGSYLCLSKPKYSHPQLKGLAQNTGVSQIHSPLDCWEWELLEAGPAAKPMLQQWHNDSHFVSVVMYVHFWCHTALIFLEIFLIQCCTVSVKLLITSSHFPYSHNARNVNISRMKKDWVFQNEKCHPSLFWNAFKMSSNHNSVHMHFSKDYQGIIPFTDLKYTPSVHIHI